MDWPDRTLMLPPNLRRIVPKSHAGGRPERLESVRNPPRTRPSERSLKKSKKCDAKVSVVTSAAIFRPILGRGLEQKVNKNRPGTESVRPETLQHMFFVVFPC